MASTDPSTSKPMATDPSPVVSSPSISTSEHQNTLAKSPTNPDSTRPSTTTSSDQESSNEDRRSRSLTRPNFTARKSSHTMLIPSDSPDVELKEEENYPPGDARAMSPRRGPEETDKMFDKSRLALTKCACPDPPVPPLSLSHKQLIGVVVMQWKSNPASTPSSTGARTCSRT